MGWFSEDDSDNPKFDPGAWFWIGDSDVHCILVVDDNGNSWWADFDKKTIAPALVTLHASKNST